MASAPTSWTWALSRATGAGNGSSALSPISCPAPNADFGGCEPTVPYSVCPLANVPGASAVVALVALVACVALAAVVAEPALVAWSAFGTVRPVTLIFAAVTALFLIFADVTAFFFSCFVPTLLLGRWTAA